MQGSASYSSCSIVVTLQFLKISVLDVWHLPVCGSLLTSGHHSCCHTMVLFVPHVCTNLFQGLLKQKQRGVGACETTGQHHL